MKKSKLTIASLLCALTLSAGAYGVATVASAENNYYETTAAVFTTTVSGATIGSAKVSDKFYTQFSIGKDETVKYAKDLAYSWYEAGEDGEGVKCNFNMTIGFASNVFKQYVIKFQSQQYAKTSDGVTTNYIVIAPDGEGLVKIAVTENIEDEIAEGDYITGYNMSEIKIAFGEFENGNYEIKINDVETGKYFKNVKESYAKNATGTAACTPLTFSCDLADGETKDVTMILYQLNGQSFERYGVVESTSGSLSNGKLHDDTAPVLVIDEAVSYLKAGGGFDFTYKSIDVIRSSITPTAYYYVLTGSQYASQITDYEKLGGTNADNGEVVFTKVTSSATVRFLRENNNFVPSEYVNDNGLTNVYGLVKAYFELTDTSSTTSNPQKSNVFLHWYVSEDQLVDIYSANLKDDSSKSSKFIKIAQDTEGASYTDGSAITNEAEYKTAIANIQSAYQAKIDAAIAKLENGEITAGSSSYMYLPEFSEFVQDNYDAYQNMKYGVYYYTNSQGQATSLAYNNMSINVKEYCSYKFAIYVTDAAGNSMRYPVTDGDGVTTWKELKSSDIWNKDYSDYIPFFTFTVRPKLATVEKPGTQSLAYVGTSYTKASFKIDGVNGEYSTAYKLYVFDRDKYISEVGSITYEEFVKNLNEVNNLLNDPTSRAKYFTEIKASADLHESDEGYAMMSKYSWNKSSVSFIPQSASEFYVVELTLKDNNTMQSTNEYLAVRASVKPASIAGESDWLKNNYVSVILLSVAALSLIGLVVLIVVKPKEKGDIDVIAIEEIEKQNGND